MRLLSLTLCALLALPAAAQTVRPQPRPVVDPIPVTRWDFRPESDRWSRASIKALKSHGRGLVQHTPRDIGRWCPGYARGSDVDRRAFWVGFLSALAKYESTWKPRAVGGGGLWYGLLQILPQTARGYGCAARTGDALKDGPANLSCAIRIMARTVPRDGVIHARSPRWSGVSADWGPMRSDAKRREMRRWLRAQEYCQISVSPRPRARPAPDGLVMGPIRRQVTPIARPSQEMREAPAASSLETEALAEDPGEDEAL
ncbi:Transglycosylase SLT domain protein [Rhodobacteraceae bacterium THAF1]|uniref:transglycosylase SLT domain-containing protein n=1 Tax=Palleronia sp. THAF1 TaxID=2587842 RepID=UPI000F3B4FDC|nr:transglycosylase SLT domain-containing protein [Palleronia sp. THAF1]QFU09248.1 Transglycosylase SLT domain protein [Palleronia sp. THAF1]VDC27374.1 Transglycosylase SLT domain protein [Rhodobacteraceae bacterium THAF1]